MFPFIDLKIIKIPMYGLCILSGIMLAFITAWRLSVRTKKDFSKFIVITTIAISISMIGAKIFHLLLTFGFRKFFWSVYMTLFHGKEFMAGTGFVFYGGLIFAIPGYILGCKIAKAKLTEFIDILAVVVPLAHAFGRLGCFFGGCCYGIPYEGPLALHYTHPITNVPTDTGIFPVQLLEASLLLAVFATLLLLFARGKKNLIFIYIFSYCPIRFTLEFLRGDLERGHLGTLSTSQIVSLILFPIFLGLFIFLTAKNKNKDKFCSQAETGV